MTQETKYEGFKEDLHFQLWHSTGSQSEGQSPYRGHGVTPGWSTNLNFNIFFLCLTLKTWLVCIFKCSMRIAVLYQLLCLSHTCDYECAGTLTVQLSSLQKWGPAIKVQETRLHRLILSKVVRGAEGNHISHRTRADCTLDGLPVHHTTTYRDGQTSPSHSHS